MSVSTNTTVLRDLAYARIDGRSLTLDLYLPTSLRASSLPVVLYLHGGGFRFGSKLDFAEERLLPLVHSGIAVASAEYRLTDAACYPAQLHDVKAAVRWLRAHAAEHGLRSDRIGAWGASAGGYLALMLALTYGNDELEGTLGEHGDVPSSVQAVTAWFAPVDLITADAYQPPPDWPLPRLDGPPPPPPSIFARLLGLERVTDDTKLARAASPLTHARNATGAFLLMHGDRDPFLPEDQSRALRAALQDAGADSTLLVLAGATHEDPSFHHPAALGAVTAFFDANLW